jgi:hypothetical protein
LPNETASTWPRNMTPQSYALRSNKAATAIVRGNRHVHTSVGFHDGQRHSAEQLQSHYEIARDQRSTQCTIDEQCGSLSVGFLAAVLLTENNPTGSHVPRT